MRCRGLVVWLMIARITPSMAEEAPRSSPKLLELPDVRQATGYTCGVAGLMAVLAYFGKGGDPRENTLARDLGSSAERGTNPKSILRIAKKYGLDSEIRQGMTLADLEKLMDDGSPVMVAFQAWSDSQGKTPYRNDWNDGHYAIVVGIDAERVYLEDPSILGARGYVDRADFLSRWHDVDGFNRRWNQLGIVFRSEGKPVHEVVVKDLMRID